MTSENDIEFLKTVSIFDMLTDAEVAVIGSHFTPRTYGAGEKIVREGEKSDTFYILRQGTVNITRGPDKLEIFIAAIRPGEYFGEASLFHNVTRIANVKANEEVRTLEIRREEFAEYLQSHPIAANRILFQMLLQLFLRLEQTSSELQFERRDLFDNTSLDQLLSRR